MSTTQTCILSVNVKIASCQDEQFVPFCSIKFKRILAAGNIFKHSVMLQVWNSRFFKLTVICNVCHV